jgi:Flp pilus assembly protein TadG
VKPPVRERGSSLPETAIVIAVLLAIIFGVVDFGRAMYTYAFVAQIAREGARWAIVRGSQCNLIDHCNAKASDVQTYVQSLSEGATTAASISAAPTWNLSTCPPGSAVSNAPGCTVSVTVTYPFQFLYLPENLGTITMSSTSKMVISQ